MRSDPSLVFPLFNTISWRWLNLASIHWNCWFAWIPYLLLHSLTLISIPKVIVIVSKGIAKFLCWSESNPGFWYPPLSLSMTELSCCLCGCELLLHPFPLMWKILQFIWVPWVYYSLKTRGAGESLKQRPQISYRRPFHWNLTYFLDFIDSGIAKYASFRPIVHIFLSGTTFPLIGTTFPSWSADTEFCFSGPLGWLLGEFPYYSFLQETTRWEIGPLWDVKLL